MSITIGIDPDFVKIGVAVIHGKTIIHLE